MGSRRVPEGLLHFRRTVKIWKTNSLAPFSAPVAPRPPPLCVCFPTWRGASRVAPPGVYVFSNASREKHVFPLPFFRNMRPVEGETRRVPRGPPRPHTRGKADDRRPRTRFRRCSRAHGRLCNRNTTRDARALVSDRRATTSRKSGATRKTCFSKVAFRLLLGRRTHDATIVFFSRNAARKRPRGKTFGFPQKIPSVPPCFFYPSLFTALRRGFASRQNVKVGKEASFARQRPAALPKGRRVETIMKRENIAPRDVRARKRENGHLLCTYLLFHESDLEFRGAPRGRRKSFS